MVAGSSITTTNATAGAVQINVNAAGGGTGTATLGDITVNNGGNLTVATNTGGNVTGGAITQVAGTSLNVSDAQLSTGSAAGATGAITLNNATNDFGTVTISRGANVTLQDSNALNIGASTISGTLGVTTNGAVTQSGALTVTGVSTLAAGAANNITLNNAGNNFSTLGITTGNNVAITDSNALILGTSTVSGNLNVTTDGAITDSGNLAMAGTTTLAAGAANNITLNNANNFNTVAISSGNNVALVDTNALVLGASTVSGTLGLTTGGALTQSGVLNVTGTTTFTASAANTDILLGTQANNFGNFAFAGTLANFRDVSLRNINAAATVPAVNTLTSLRNLTLTYDNAAVALPTLTLTASGNLNVTSGGAITQTGVLTIPGTTTLAAGAVSDITLNNTGNDFTGTLTINSGRNVTMYTSDTFTVGNVTTNGNMTLTSDNGTTINGAVNVGSGTFASTINNDGGTVGDFSMAAGASITTTNASATAVVITANVNPDPSPGQNDRGIVLGNITTGNGGTITAQTNPGGITTGASIDQVAGTVLNTGSGSVVSPHRPVGHSISGQPLPRSKRRPGP